MKTRKATSAAAVSLATLLLLGACGSDGENPPPPGSGSTDGSSSTEGGSGSDAAAIYSEIASWDPCEVLGDDYNAMLEALNVAEPDEELLSAPVGSGNWSDHAMCSSNVVWAEDPDYESGDARGLVDIAVIPKSSEEDAASRYAELSDGYRDLFKTETAVAEAAEKEIPGWDEGVLIFGGLGVGDTFFVIVRDGSYLIRIGLETGSRLVGEQPGANADFTVEEARDYLIDVALPGIKSTVTERLEEAGVSSGE